MYKKQRKQAKLTRREERRQQREKKRRRIQEEKKRIKQEAELQRRIALEERKLLIALRQLESIRLLTELLERVKVCYAKRTAEQGNNNCNNSRFLCSSFTHPKGVSKRFQHCNPCLLGNVQQINATKLNQSQESSLPSQVTVYPWVRERNNSVSCSGTRV